MSETLGAAAPAEAPQPNTPEARTETGEIKPVVQPTTTPTPEPTLAAKEVPAAAPEAYEFKVPEGYELPKETVEKVTPVFKELGLSNDAAQKMFDLHQSLVKEAQEAPGKLYEKMRADWRTEVVGDKTIGDGRSDLSSIAKQDINAAYGAIGDAKLVADFKDAMNLTGAGDNPAFLRAFAALGKHFREGTAVTGKGPAEVVSPNAKPKSIASSMYPNLSSSS